MRTLSHRLEKPTLSNFFYLVMYTVYAPLLYVKSRLFGAFTASSLGPPILILANASPHLVDAVACHSCNFSVCLISVTFFKLSFYLFFLSLTSCISIPFVSLSLCIHPMPLQPPQNRIEFTRNKKRDQSHNGSYSMTQ